MTQLKLKSETIFILINLLKDLILNQNKTTFKNLNIIIHNIILVKT